MMRAFSMRRESDALIEAISKTTMTIAPIEQAVTATPAMTSAFFASIGGGLVTFASSTTTNNNNKEQLLLAEIGRRATLCTADPREATFLYQRISVAIQRFNAVCLANSLTVSESPS